MIVVYVLRRTTVHKGYVTSVLFVNKVLTLFTCDNGSEKSTGVNENEHTCDPLLIWFKIKIFSHPAITDSRYYGHQIAVPRVSAITGVENRQETKKIYKTLLSHYSSTFEHLFCPGGGAVV